MPMKRSIAVVMSILAAGCGGELPSISPDLDTLPGEPVQVVRLEAYYPHAGFDTSARLVVENEAEWTLVWQRLWSDHDRIPALPSIDFERERVLVAAMGRRPTGGYAIRVDAAAAQEAHLAVRVVQTSPGGVCLLTQAITAPIDIVKLPRTSQPIQFQTVRKVDECS
jgi:hypothetical protein